MTRILVMSDSHGDAIGLQNMVRRVWETTGPIDAYLHLGDGWRDFTRLENLIWSRDPQAIRLQVKGNCDLGADLPDFMTTVIGPWKVFMTHGHLWHVKQDYNELDDAGYAEGCDLTLFGHTHAAWTEQKLTRLVNPGSARDGRLALITEGTDGKPEVRLMRFD